MTKINNSETTLMIMTSKWPNFFFNNNNKELQLVNYQCNTELQSTHTRNQKRKKPCEPMIIHRTALTTDCYQVWTYIHIHSGVRLDEEKVRKQKRNEDKTSIERIKLCRKRLSSHPKGPSSLFLFLPIRSLGIVIWSRTVPSYCSFSVLFFTTFCVEASTWCCYCQWFMSMAANLSLFPLD